MLSKNDLKFITSLSQKKYREKNGMFLAEGLKTIEELVREGVELYKLYSTHDISLSENISNIEIISQTELRKISQQIAPQDVVGIFKIPQSRKPEYKGLIIALDKIQDPGNLGTIIRLCDWFGVENILCSSDSVDCYNPKVIQATMGSIARVNLFYTELENYLNKATIPVFTTLLNGQNIYNSELPETAIVVMGNEANGISPDIIKKSFKALHIPKFNLHQRTESLNVATATAIVLSEFRRR